MKYAWISEQSDSYAVTRLCRVLGISRSGFLPWRTRPPSPRALANAAPDTEVATLHAESDRSYGRPRLPCIFQTLFSDRLTQPDLPRGIEARA